MSTVKYRKSQAKHFKEAHMLVKKLAGDRYDELLSSKKTQDIVDLRWQIARKLRSRKFTLEQIGAALERDHTTVIYMLAPDNYRLRKIQMVKARTMQCAK